MTQSMISHRSLDSLQLGLGRLAKVQEQLSTGRVLNRPSDSPTDTTSAMRIRSAYTRTEQYIRNADDAVGRLGLADTTLGTMGDQVRRVRELVQQSRSGASSTVSREALATEIEQLHGSLLADANTKYLDRPIFGGITAGTDAYDDTGTFIGVAGTIGRKVGSDVTVRVDLDPTEFLGSGPTSVFAAVENAALALRSGDEAGINTALDQLSGFMNDINAARATVGARQAQVERSQAAAEDAKVDLTSRLTDLENVDVAAASIDLKLQEMAYQAALAATARVVQPSLLDFLR
ncbi:flagellin [Nocardioides pantholopis]|uniref:flagellin N-terminal helical domain-containing protein n=1 Tax=Nocardioides pantholopis TaxID=2483798 RepID=UPI0013DE4922|nr:flagellin [Nocardioides pantholopis]